MKQKGNGAIEDNSEVMAPAANEEPYKSGSVQYMDSREVAEIVGKEHHKLLRDIRRYTEQMGLSNSGLSADSQNLTIIPTDFFMESTYQNSQNKTMPCYLITRKGCEFIAHKLTGKKGSIFTATYINRFHEMEDRLRMESGYVPLEMVEQIVDKRMAERLKEPHGSSQYDFADIYTIQSRKMEIYEATAKAAEMFGMAQNSILHLIYKALEKRFGIVLDAYKAVYRSETGRHEAGMAEVIAANDRIYKEAMYMYGYVMNDGTDS